jgi:hypothetical protein
MTNRTYLQGVPCWVDTEQPDVEAATAFYGGSHYLARSDELLTQLAPDDHAEPGVHMQHGRARRLPRTPAAGNAAGEDGWYGRPGQADNNSGAAGG